MKIAISSSGQTLDSQVDPRFGRAAYFIIIDSESMEYEVIDNENTSASGGAGIVSAKSVIDSGAKVILTGNCGPNAQRALSSANVKLYTNVSGIILDAIELFKKGDLTEVSEPNVSSHFGMGNTND